jgi:hypothetical protein
MKNIVILFLCLFLSGCIVALQNLNDPGFEKIRMGMSKEEVIAAIGKPLSQVPIAINGKEYEAWNYPAERPIKTKINQVGDYYYRILFLEGKARQFEKVKVYAQPSYDFREPTAKEGQFTTFKFYKE